MKNTTRKQRTDRRRAIRAARLHADELCPPNESSRNGALWGMFFSEALKDRGYSIRKTGKAAPK